MISTFLLLILAQPIVASTINKGIELNTVFFLYLLTSLLATVQIFFPKRCWWLFVAWQYRNPQANEPSDTVYFLWRIGAAFLLTVSLSNLFIRR